MWHSCKSNRTSKFPLQESSPVENQKAMNQRAAAKYKDHSNAFELNQDLVRLPIIKEESKESEELKDFISDRMEQSSLQDQAKKRKEEKKRINNALDDETKV